jgi:4-amino-4-deoxy-L-arabinose transferase-like glycosyltransferase
VFYFLEFNVVRATLSKFLNAPPKQFLILVYALALFTRLLFVIIKGSPVAPDYQEHTTIAHNMYAGYGYSMHWPYESMLAERQEIYKHPPTFEGSFQPPLNPYLIYTSHLIFGENEVSLYAIMVLYSIIGALLPILAYKIAYLISDDRKAKISAIIALCFLPAAYSVITYSGTPLYTITAMGFLFGCLSIIQQPNLSGYLIAGLCGGLTALLRSEFLVLGLLLFFVAIVLQRKKQHKVILRYAMIAIVLHIGLASIWVTRNYFLYDHILLSGTHSWHEIWRGNNERSSGTTYDGEGKLVWIHPTVFPDLVRQVDSIPYDRFFEYRIDGVFRKTALLYMKQHPIQTAGRTLKKALIFLTFDPTHPYASNPIYFGSMIFLSICFITSFFQTIKQGFLKFLTSPQFLLFSFLGLYLAQVSISEMLPRYQIYVFSVLLPLSGIGFEKLTNRFKRS